MSSLDAKEEKAEQMYVQDKGIMNEVGKTNILPEKKKKEGSNEVGETKANQEGMQEDAKRWNRERKVGNFVPSLYESSSSNEEETGDVCPKQTKQWVYLQHDENRSKSSTSIPRTKIGKCIRTMRSPSHANKVSAFLTDMSSTCAGLLFLLRSTGTRAEGIHAAASNWHGDTPLRWLLHLGWCLHVLLGHHCRSHAVFGQRL
jgi:hypothetical protein